MVKPTTATTRASTTEDVRDWLAIILIGAGSSFARGPDRDDTIGRVLSGCRADWKHLFDLYGREVSVNVYDVTGHDSIWWDDRGIHSEDEASLGPIPKGTVEKWTFASRAKKAARI